MSINKFQWFLTLAISSSLLIWRLFDLTYEIVNHQFTMARFGIHMHGMSAIIIELSIIFSLIILSWFAFTKINARN